MRGKFSHPLVTARYYVNIAIILTLYALPTFHIIKLDFFRGEFYLFGNEVGWLKAATGFVAFWAGSYVITLLADYIYGRLFCGWICSWGSLLRFLSYARDKAKRKKLPSWAPFSIAIVFSLIATTGLMNWFSDLTILVEPTHQAFIPLLSIYTSLVVIGAVMLWKVGLRFCQEFCPIGMYLGVISQKHRMRIDFDATNCTTGDVCVRECPMALDPRLLSMETDKDNHNACILCGDCLISCNKCAAKVEGQKPLIVGYGHYEPIDIDLSALLDDKKRGKGRSKLNKQESVIYKN
jgi:ferredoxin-type protein NapH